MTESGRPSKHRILPPIYFFGAIALMVALDRFLPLVTLFEAPVAYLGWLVFALAIAVVLAVAWQFKRAGTTIKPFEHSRALVTGGLFAFSRNPIYLAMAAGLVGIFLVLGSLTPLVIIPAFIYIIRTRFIAAEERMLEDTFGEAYRDYRNRVRRWL